MAQNTVTRGRNRLPLTTQRVLKALSLFTGVQSVSVLVAIIRTKLVALWIGPAGVGILSLYAWAIQLITTITQFNIGQSAVRDISRTVGCDSKVRMAALVRRLGLVIGVGGGLLTMLLSPLLSKLTFGDYTHTTAFIALATLLPLSAVTAAEGALMQGFERLRQLAKSTVLGAVVGTAVAIPLYYFFRINAIVPVLICFGLSNCAFALVYGVRTDSTDSPGVLRALREGREMLRLGSYLTVSTFAGLGATYAFMVFLNGRYSEETVGVFNSGSTLLTSYVGIIFTAISMEFYPRLSKVVGSAFRTRTVVSHEASMSLLVVCPVTVIVICCGELIINILYSSGFEAASPFVSIGMIAMTLKAPAWCMAYCMVARGDGRTFLITEIASAVLYLVLSTLLFSRFGFTGLGVAYVVWYVFYMAVVYYVYHHRYGLRLSAGVWRQLAVVLAVDSFTLALDAYIGHWLTLGIVLPLTLFFSMRYFRRQKNKRI